MDRDSEFHVSELQAEPEARAYRPENVQAVLHASVPDRFDTKEEYADTFKAFLELEIAEERSKRDHLSRSDYEVLWRPGLGAVAEVRFASVKELSARDQLRVTDPQGHSAVFRISSIRSETSSVLLKSLDGMEDLVMSDSLRYRVEFVATRVHLRMLTGLQQFEFGAEVYQPIADIILGKAIPEKLPLPGNYQILLPPKHPLDTSQVAAVQFALTRPFALIRGPPGTGKTTTAASIIYNLITLTRERVLVCAPSNIAVDQLTQRLATYDGVRPLRIYSRNMIDKEEELLAEGFALHRAVREKLAAQYPIHAEAILNRHKPLSEISAIPATQISRLEREIVNDYHVVCCTCSNTITEYIRGLRFGAVVLDEAGYATEPDALLPVLKGIRRFVMLGDENQLPPFVQSKTAITIGYGRSMFERLVTIGVPVHQINVQYRMHPDLSSFSNREIYAGTLIDAESTRERLVSGLESYWGGCHPLVFYHVTGAEEPASAFSYYNRKEAVLIEELLYRLTQYSISSEDIGIITPYEGQREYIAKVIKEKGRVTGQLEIKNLDGFQGREKRFILFSSVRSNMESELGFLHNKRRLNVAITRAQSGLVLVGNKIVLSNDKMWRKLINHISDLRQVKNGDAILREVE